MQEQEEEIDVLDDLFAFPIISADGEIERKKHNSKQEFKERFGDMVKGQEEDDDELDVAYGWAEYPHHLFVGLTDRWLPTKVSFEKAQQGDFEACYVHFSGIGAFVVPWTREKFKSEYNSFVKEFRNRHKKPEIPASETATAPKMVFLTMMPDKEEDKQDGE